MGFSVCFMLFYSTSLREVLRTYVDLRHADTILTD